MILKRRRPFPPAAGSPGFSLTELMVVLVIIGILTLLALPRFRGLITRAKMTEAQIMLRQLYGLQHTFRFERDHFSPDLVALGFEQQPLLIDGGTARYRVEVESASPSHFVATATSVVDFDGDGIFNVWAVDEQGGIVERTPD